MAVVAETQDLRMYKKKVREKSRECHKSQMPL